MVKVTNSNIYGGDYIFANQRILGVDTSERKKEISLKCMISIIHFHIIKTKNREK